MTAARFLLTVAITLAAVQFAAADSKSKSSNSGSKQKALDHGRYGCVDLFSGGL